MLDARAGIAAEYNRSGLQFLLRRCCCCGVPRTTELFIELTKKKSVAELCILHVKL